MNKLTSLFGGIAVIAIALVFVFSFQPGGGMNQVQEGPACAAEVRTACVRATHFWAAYRLLAPRNADPAILRSMGLRTRTMDGLIERQLLVDDARRLGLGVSEDDLTRELASGRVRVSVPSENLREFAMSLGLTDDGVRLMAVTDRKTGKFDAKAYERQVRLVSKMSAAEFRDFQREEILAARMRDLVRSRARVGDAEGRAQFQREKTTSTLSIIRFNRSFYGDYLVDEARVAIEAWALRNKDEVDRVWAERRAKLEPECRVVRHVLARIDVESPKDVEQQLDEARAKLDELKKRFDGGEAIADLARALSDDPSALRGGDLGCVARGRLPKPIDEVVFAATKTGELSGIIEHREGLSVVLVERIATGDDLVRIGRAETARELYVKHEAERLAAEAGKTVLAAVQKGQSLEDALAAHLAWADARAPEDKRADPEAKKRHPDQPTIETTLPFNESGDPIEGVEKGHNAAAIAFSLKAPGAVADDLLPIATGYAVLALKERREATDEQWAEERDFYLSAMRQTKQQEALANYVRRLKSDAHATIKINTSFTREVEATEPLDE